MYLNIDGVAHLPIPEVLWHSANWGLSGLLVKLHDHAVNASKDPKIDRSSNSIGLRCDFNCNASLDLDNVPHKSTSIHLAVLAHDTDPHVIVFHNY